MNRNARRISEPKLGLRASLPPYNAPISNHLLSFRRVFREFWRTGTLGAGTSRSSPCASAFRRRLLPYHVPPSYRLLTRFCLHATTRIPELVCFCSEARLRILRRCASGTTKGVRPRPTQEQSPRSPESRARENKCCREKA